MQALELLGISGPMIALQAIPFFLVLIGLNTLVFQPTLKVIARREAAIGGQAAAAAGLTDDVAERAAALDARVRAAKVQAAEERAQLRAATQAEAEAVLAAARAEANAAAEAGLRAVEREQEAARAALRASADTLGRSVAEAVLGRALKG